VIYVLISALYKLFVCVFTELLSSLSSFHKERKILIFLFYAFFLTYFVPLLVYFLTYLSTSSRIDPFQAGGRRRRPNLASVFVLILCCCIFCYGCMSALCLFSFFSTKPRDWLGRTSPILF